MKKIFNIVLAGIAVMMSGSCEKSFELQRPNQEPWQSVDELDLAAHAGYLHFTERPWENALGLISASGFGESDIALYTTAVGDSWCAEYAKRTFSKLTLGTTHELETSFFYLYTISTETNAALKVITDAEDAGKDPFSGMTDDDRAKLKEYKGELLFQRGLAYWYLIRKWAPPYSEENKDKKYITMYRTYVSSADKLKNSTLATLGEVYDGILSDFRSAADLLPEDYPKEDESARMRVNKYAAKGMLARVLFYMGAEANKSEILTLLEQIIGKTTLYSLDEEPYAAFSKMGAGYGKETIWQICYSSDSERYDRMPGMFSYFKYNSGGPDAPSGYISFAMSYTSMIKVGWMKATAVPSKENPYPFTITDEAKKDKRFNQLYKFVTEYQGHNVPLLFVHKYFRDADQNAKAQRHANRPVIRLADMLLMRAQIYFMNGKTKEALDDVNAVRRRAGLDDLISISSDLIEYERIKEMAAENADRINWLVGLKKEIGIGDRDASQYDPIQYPYTEMFYQVPQVELQANSAYDDIKY